MGVGTCLRAGAYGDIQSPWIWSYRSLSKMDAGNQTWVFCKEQYAFFIPEPSPQHTIGLF